MYGKITNIDMLEIIWSSWHSDMSWYSNGKPDDVTKVNKRTEWTSEYVYNFYGFLSETFPGVGKTFLSS